MAPVAAFPTQPPICFFGNAGTAFRPLTAALAVLGGDYHLHGVPRMHERPIGDLVDALRIVGADVQYLGNETTLRFRSVNAKTTASALFRLKAMFPANS